MGAAGGRGAGAGGPAHRAARRRRAAMPLQAGTFRLAGRVGFISLAGPAAAPRRATTTSTAATACWGASIDWSQPAPDMQPLVRQLLGRTWAVEMLEHARPLAGDAGIDGRVPGDAGRRSRPRRRHGRGRSQGRGRADLTPHGTARPAARGSRAARTGRARASRRSRRLQENIDQQQVVAAAAGRSAQGVQPGTGRPAGGLPHARPANWPSSRKRPRGCRRSRRPRSSSCRAWRDGARTPQRQLADLEARLAELEAAAKQERELAWTKASGSCATASGWPRPRAWNGPRASSDWTGMRLQLRQFEADQQERSRALADAQRQLASAADRRRVAVAEHRSQATSELALLYLDKDALAGEIAATQPSGIAQLAAQRASSREQLKTKQRELGQLRDKLHQGELAAGEVRHERTTLADRLREDYGLEIAELVDDADDQQLQQCEAVEQEIAGLKRKISNIGAVNMEALHELDDLETRYESLHSQFQDLTQAKESLERIIHKINADSRRLFSETLEAIRANFQQLYRKAFGGGKADIVLEEGVDILECGVDIVATPPGKPSFNNSLLSGGEKALTAVALLLAIFQYRPSPFCVLDEVDAPFDEANIGRFVDVLKDFLGWTKFVIVTHSKKTMTAATTLYGVTMQESGVSKQVSVRFEDVSEDGRISAEAVRRSDRESAADDEQAA